LGQGHVFEIHYDLQLVRHPEIATSNSSPLPTRPLFSFRHRSRGHHFLILPPSSTSIFLPFTLSTICNHALRAEFTVAISSSAIKQRVWIIHSLRINSIMPKLKHAYIACSETVANISPPTVVRLCFLDAHILHVHGEMEREGAARSQRGA
jgi:hypothetical protein